MFESFKKRIGLFLSITSKFRENFGRVLTLRFDRGGISTLGELVEFTQTRSAYVAQTSLYGYLKTRMGIRYPKAFEDDVMSASIDLAKWRVFCACVSDLSIFVAATIAGPGGLDKRATKSLASHCFTLVITETFADSDYSHLVKEVVLDFKNRIKNVAWDKMAELDNAFQLSPEDLVKYAPVIDDYRERDREIVMNSIRFRWRDIREQFRRRFEASALAEEWRAVKP